MKTILFYILKSPYKKVPPGLTFSNPNDKPYAYLPASESLQRQHREFGIDMEIIEIGPDEIPTKAGGHLLCFLDQNAIIPSDYVARILALNNLHTNAVAFCGPVFTEKSVHKVDWFISKIAAQYKKYSLDNFGSVISCRLNDDEQNFPSISGTVYVGHHYGKTGGVTTTNSRYSDFNTVSFLNKLSPLGDIIYSSRLSTGYFITTEELEIENFGKYYYNMGYRDGLRATPAQMYHQYAQNNNLLEFESLSWATQREEVKDNNEYIKHIAIFKCLYELGYFEAFTKTRIV